jgi:hypothetical protein
MDRNHTKFIFLSNLIRRQCYCFAKGFEHCSSITCASLIRTLSKYLYQNSVIITQTRADHKFTCFHWEGKTSTLVLLGLYSVNLGTVWLVFSHPWYSLDCIQSTLLLSGLYSVNHAISLYSLYSMFYLLSESKWTCDQLVFE